MDSNTQQEMEEPKPELRQIPSVLQPPVETGPTAPPPDSDSGRPAQISTTPPGSPPALVRATKTPKSISVKKAKTSNGSGRIGNSAEVSLLQSPSVDDGSQAQPTGQEVSRETEAGPSSVPAKKTVVRKIAPKKSAATVKEKKLKAEKLFMYTSAYSPALFNIKNPAGDFLMRESNVEVIRQISQAKAKKEKEEAEAERERKLAAGEDVENVHPLAYTLIIHPGSRNLRIGRASDFYPKEVPFCIARPEVAVNKGREPPIPGSRAKRMAEVAIEKQERKKARLAGNAEAADSEGDAEWVDPVDSHIEDLRDYLRNRLRQNRLSTDVRDGVRVKQFNAKVKPESIPEHNDPYRIDWTEVGDKKFFVGTEALRLPSGSGFKVRYPFLHRALNTRDWATPQLLMDDIATILQETMWTELGIHPRDYSKYSVVLLVADHNDRLHLQSLVSLLFGEFGFKEMAIHQEAHAAVFSAGMSSACVVDIGATSTSVACIDDGMLVADTRIKLDYGGDDITAALATLLSRSNFPYKELDLGKPMEWLMMEKLKEKICTFEEHMVANIAWDIHVLKEKGLTQKYPLRTYDENILAPLCFFDTRMIDFEEKDGSGHIALREESEDIDDLLSTGYGEPTAAMKACVTHLLPAALVPDVQITEVDPEPNDTMIIDAADPPAAPRPEVNGSQTSEDKRPADTPAGSVNGTPAPPDMTPTLPPAPIVPAQPTIPDSAYDGIDIIGEAAHSPLDAAIAASISVVAKAGSENKIKAAAGNILLIGGGSALKGLYPFVADRLPPLLRAKGLPVSEVSIVPPPRGLNPRYSSWKGCSVMCNLEIMSDMWIRRDEWDALGARSLKERLPFL